VRPCSASRSFIGFARVHRAIAQRSSEQLAFPVPAILQPHPGSTPRVPHPIRLNSGTGTASGSSPGRRASIASSGLSVADGFEHNSRCTTQVPHATALCCACIQRNTFHSHPDSLPLGHKRRGDCCLLASPIGSGGCVVSQPVKRHLVSCIPARLPNSTSTSNPNVPIPTGSARVTSRRVGFRLTESTFVHILPFPWGSVCARLTPSGSLRSTFFLSSQGVGAARLPPTGPPLSPKYLTF
jgi:hypothetical protein